MSRLAPAIGFVGALILISTMPSAFALNGLSSQSVSAAQAVATSKPAGAALQGGAMRREAQPSWATVAVATAKVAKPAIPKPVAPKPVAPKPVAPKPVAPAPVASTPPASIPVTTTSVTTTPAAAPVQAASVTEASTALGWGCADALAYLKANANPAYSLVCPGFAQGHQAMTCNELAGICSGFNEIVIAIPCPAAYENEAWNSWHIVLGPFDPFGSCP